MDVTSLLLGLVVGALLATAVTLGLVSLLGRRQPADAGLEPVHESLDHLHRLLAGIERDRATAHGELREQVSTVGATSALLRQETSALVTALRTPHVRGRWGEVQLRRLVEVAGLLDNCDFVEQPGGTTSDGARVRPDLVVTLSDGRQVLVDAKVPFAGWIEAVQATDEAVRAQRVADHARQLRAHVDVLAARHYPSAFSSAAPFTVLFVPSDGFLITALEAEPALLEHAFARDVVIATPSTLLTLLRTVAWSWRQERLARDATAVLEVGRTVHARLATLSGHLTRLGSALGSAVGRYNDTVGSYENSVLVAARRFDDLGVAESPVPAPTPVDTGVRPLRAVPPPPAPGATGTGPLAQHLPDHPAGRERAPHDLPSHRAPDGATG
ncbi:DNA recombination protein RmuC [Modestobacter sp. I12A-02628]|uniref:DNA recombination protein RmuC n=1 Tax=Goekera deserti TaxID=2497753 RepID=A0A7K3WCI5_9ACTN|nr:DNA recombination protein RmuC [Goekera deserti]MPQ98599.1 DNA recombination protein RmuC [Goekera deserti]NDI49031.1 DNA recombination protein RmuC [Goekera deserti]NEL54178.1 DNA recombination protein RmuC [Goekera deserti]